MPLPISTTAIQEKNRLAGEGVWLLLLEFIYSNEAPVRVVWNTENITWDGETWYALPFELGDIEDSKDGNAPSVSLNLIDIERRILPLVDKYNGALTAEAWIRIVHSDHLDNTVAEFEEKFEVIEASHDHIGTIRFKLGAENLTNYRSPPDIFLKGHCRYKTFKGSRCGYDGAETECNRTFERCRQLENQVRFGGFPGIGALGYWK